MTSDVGFFLAMLFLDNILPCYHLDNHTIESVLTLIPALNLAAIVYGGGR